LHLVVFVNDGNARRVVAALFKLAQAVDNQRHYLFLSDVSDYSTHVSEQ
jgi:type III secretory pathway component EscT